MINQWAGEFKDQINIADDGTVSFNVDVEDIQGNEAAQFLYDLVNDPETMLFYAGTDAAAAGNLVEEGKNTPFSRETLMKRFTGEAYAEGGGYFVATRGRVTDKGDAASATPANGVFAVIAFNTDAKFFEIQGARDSDSSRDKKKDPADIPIPLQAFYIHEGAENLDFARAKREGTVINSTLYTNTSHPAAILREKKIREQLKMTGGYAGGSIRAVAPKNKKQ